MLALVAAGLALLVARGSGDPGEAPGLPLERRQAIYAALWHAGVEAGEAAGIMTPPDTWLGDPEGLVRERKAAADRLVGERRRLLAGRLGLGVEVLRRVESEGDREGWEVE